MSELRLSPWSLFLFSLPSIFSSLLEPLASIVDTALVGNLNTKWLASLAIGVAILNTFTWMFNFLVHVSTQNVADSRNQTSPELLTKRIKVSLASSIIVAALCTLFLFFSRHLLYDLMDAQKNLIPVIESYYLPRVFFHFLSVMLITLVSILRGLEKLKLCLVIVGVTTLINVLLSYFFLYHLGWGLEGAAWGTIFSQALGVLACAYFLFSDKRVLSIFAVKVELNLVKDFSSSSRDIFIRSFLLSLCFFSGTKIASRIGVSELGAYQILIQVWLFSSFLLDGLAITANVLMAKYYFSDMKEKAVQVVYSLSLLSLLIGVFFTLIYGFFPSFVISIFSSDPKVLLICEALWPWIVWSQVISAFAFLLDGLIFGVSKFFFLRKHMIIGVLLFFVPLAFSALRLEHLHFLLAAFVMLNIYRMASGVYLLRKESLT